LLAAGEEWLAAALAPDPAGVTVGDGTPAGGLAAYLASVHTDNAASRRLFLGSGYLPDQQADAGGFERFVKWARPGPR
jgi:hypothetical protein